MTIKTTPKKTVKKPTKRFDEYLEYTLGNSAKFWGIIWDGDESIDIYWGRISSENCRTHKKTFTYHLEAIRWLKEKISEKKNKGYA